MDCTDPPLNQGPDVPNGGIPNWSDGKEKIRGYYIRTTTEVGTAHRFHQLDRTKSVDRWRQRRVVASVTARRGHVGKGRIQGSRIRKAMTTEGGADLRLLQRPCRTRDDAHLVVPGAGASGRRATIGKRTDP
jgi:hypothetical protein